MKKINASSSSWQTFAVWIFGVIIPIGGHLATLFEKVFKLIK